MENKQRMEWLDAMRGFTMILVVAYHVAQYAFGQSEKTSASLPFLVLFRMPLFFFVSGFLAYKSKWIWTTASFLSLTWKKVKIQVLPAFIFFCVMLVFRSKNAFEVSFMNNLASPTKGGYWFTWVLLQMFIIYYIVAWISQKMKNSNIPIILLWFVCLCGSVSLFLPKTLGKWYECDFLMYSSFYQTIKFMHFFVLGNLAHRYWGGVQKVFDSKWFFPIITIIAFASCADIFRLHILKWEWTNLPKTAAMYSLLLLVIMFFRHYQAEFTSDKKVGKILQYIGVRTLDIYLLHFIFMPKLPMVGKWLQEYHPNFVVDIVCAGSVAAVVIGFCILTSNLLRISPIFREYLFGRK